MGSGVLHGNMLISPLERHVHSSSDDLQKNRSARKVPSSGPFMRNLTLRLKSNEAFSSTKNVCLVRLDRRDGNKWGSGPLEKNDRNGNDPGLPEGCRGRSRYLVLLTFAPRVMLRNGGLHGLWIGLTIALALISVVGGLIVLRADWIRELLCVRLMPVTSFYIRLSLGIESLVGLVLAGGPLQQICSQYDVRTIIRMNQRVYGTSGDTWRKSVCDVVRRDFSEFRDPASNTYRPGALSLASSSIQFQLLMVV